MRRSAEIHSCLPYITTIFTAIIFFIFGLYGLSGLSGADKIRKLPLLKIGIFAIATIYLIRAVAGVIINLGFESTFQWHHLLFSICALVIGLLYLLGGLNKYIKLK